MASDKNKDTKSSQSRQLLEASSLGLMFPLAIAIGYFWGRGMDWLFGTGPWLKWIFTGLGMIAAFLNLFRIGMGSDGGAPPETKP